jgi:hypothetical protein
MAHVQPVSPADPPWLRPASPDMALLGVLAGHQNRLGDQELLLDGHRRLADAQAQFGTGMNGAFPAHCAEELVAIERLAAGQAFHKTVQSAFLTGLTGASGFPERQWRLVQGGRGRVDLAVEVDGDEQMLVIIETDWVAIPADRVMRNLRRHLRQLQAYLDTAIEDMEAGQWEGIVGALLYPARPSSPEMLAMIEAIAGEQAVQVTWYQDVDWRR